MLTDAREYIEGGELAMEERNETLRQHENIYKEVAKDDCAPLVDPEEEETARRKLSEDRKVLRKNEQILGVKKERVAEILKRDANIRLRKKKLKDYNDVEIELVEMDDLIELDREIEQIEREKKAKKMMKEFKKVDYYEREVRI